MITGTTMVMIIPRITIMRLARTSTPRTITGMTITSTPATIILMAITVTAIMRTKIMGTVMAMIIITDRSRKSCA